ncbi:MAG TPA: YHS domain-containing (seleno)protein [Cyclobacteriaceae bacterium]
MRAIEFPQLKSFAAISLQLLFGILAQSQDEASRLKNFNLKSSLVLSGYDPVSYFNSKPVEGKSQYRMRTSGVTYYFSSQTNLDKFKAAPDKYEPAYGGWCAYAMGESGEKVKVDPETYKIVDGKLYLFYNFWGNNTLTDWNKNEKALKSKADQNWRKIVQ